MALSLHIKLTEKIIYQVLYETLIKVQDRRDNIKDHLTSYKKRRSHYMVEDLYIKEGTDFRTVICNSNGHTFGESAFYQHKWLKGSETPLQGVK